MSGKAKVLGVVAIIAASLGLYNLFFDKSETNVKLSGNITEYHSRS